MEERRTEERRSIESRLVRVESEVHHLGEQFDDLKAEIRTLVTRVEFTPVQRVVYGIVGLILSAVVGALVALIMRPGAI